MDFDRLGSELLRALRGARSQVAFSRRLGYRANVAATWESGRRHPTASTLFVAAERAGVDVAGAMERFLREPPAAVPTSPEGIAALLRDLQGSTPIRDVAHRSGLSRFAVARALSGQSEPRVPDFLRLVEATSLRALDLVATLVDPTALPSVATEWTLIEASRRLSHDTPWAAAVALALELDGYRRLPAHSDAWVAERLGVDATVVARCLTLLRDAGRIRWDGTRFEPAPFAIDARRPERGTDLKQWWARIGLERLEAGQPGLFSFNVFTVSQVDWQRLQDMQRAHYRAMRALIAGSTPGEVVVLANLHLVPLGPGAG